MVTINTTDDLLRALDENPRWQEAVRHRILTEELMRLPARFDRFVAVTEAFMEEQRQVNANTAEFIDEQRQFNAEQRQINAEQRETNARMEGHIARIDNAMDRIREDIGTMKADHARTNTAREARGIAYNMGFQLVRTLSYDDLLALEIAGALPTFPGGSGRASGAPTWLWKSPPKTGRPTMSPWKFPLPATNAIPAGLSAMPSC